jgi:heat shock 70kDa protein 1/6/8
METEYAIGIDLGTTYSCVGVFINDKVEIISNKSNNKITPSVVYLNESEKIIGDEAKTKLNQNPYNTIYNVKRLMGRKYSDDTIQNNKEYFKYNITSKDERPSISIPFDGDNTRQFYPEEISAMILKEMKEIAEKYLNCNVKKAVITVPAYFTNAQREATKNAGVIAGLEVLSIINEPTAASMAYGFDQDDDINKNVLIYDFGGGTLDVSLLQISNGKYDVKAVSGNTYFGGEDFTNKLVVHISSLIQEKYDIDIIKNNDLYFSVKKECEKAKKNLSVSLKTKIEIKSIINNEDFIMYITREQFEQLCDDLFQNALKPVKQVLDDTNMFRISVNEIILVGGSSRIPKIQKLLIDYFSNFFSARQLNKSVDFDKAVAYGAAIHAFKLLGGKNKKTDNITLFDVAPLTLGVRDTNSIIVPFIKRNTKIPIKKSKNVTTGIDYQKDILIEIYEGERVSSDHCNLIGHYKFEEILIDKKCVPKIEITFELDENGILNVFAEDKKIQIKKKMDIVYDKTRLTEEDIQMIIYDAEKFKDNDQIIIDKIISKKRYNTLLNFVKETLNEIDTKDILTENEIKNISNELNEEFEWLNNNYNSISADDIDVREKNKKMKFMKSKIMPVLKKRYFELQTKEKQNQNQIDPK